MTDAKVYTPTRVPQGCSDAALHFQATVERCFPNEVLLYAEDVDTYCVKLCELFLLMNEFKFKLEHRNQAFFNDPVRHDPDRIAAHREMPLPSPAGVLQQFLCACNWMRDSSSSFAGHVQTLQKRLDVRLGKGIRTKRAANKLLVTFTTKE
ncbi:hypothetical protein PHMEG_00029805 [Phytophthora megakarya]|uniref:Reverse transcriptase RNase H-like domain-containing protein n=1 Tax=Phytophthora megakarya TaxID=4795 RepID=A0A225V1C6_9STRA|nr:hypothetical protein PHMEG_00029805 [Phytophthora megakarya]